MMHSGSVKNNSRLQPDEETIYDFIENVLQREWLHLVSIDPAKSSRNTYGFVAASPADAVDWIYSQDERKRNLYFQLNTPSRHQQKKANKEELKIINGPHIDWDLPDDWDRADARCDQAIKDKAQEIIDCTLLPGKPAVWYTGNGVQAIWLLDKPLRATEENQSLVETINKRLALQFKCKAGTHNIDRILRFPGTRNIPNAKKLERNCTVVMSGPILCEGTNDFVLDDFNKLPKVDRVVIRPTPKYTDYSRRRYQDWPDPFTWAEVKADMPELPGAIFDTLDGGEHDRSRALFRLLKDLIGFMLRKVDGLTAESLICDEDIKKNICDLCVEATEDASTVVQKGIGYAMTRVEEKGWGWLGADLDRVLNGEADRDISLERREAQAERRTKVYEINQAPADQVTPYQAKLAFIHYMTGIANSEKQALPNVIQGQEGAARHQAVTKANVEHVLVAAGITPRWDILRDRFVCVVNPLLGTTGANPTYPARNWERAMTVVLPKNRARAEIALIQDCLVHFGIENRDTAKHHLMDLAFERPFHPLEDYLAQVQWDGRDRIAELAACLETEHPLATRYLQVHFYSCVAGVKSFHKFMKTETGEQLSSSVILKGPQGIGKSTFWDDVTPAGFTAPGTSLNLNANGMALSDTMREALCGMVAVLQEVGQTLDRSETNRLKDFKSKPYDEFRLAHAQGDAPLRKPRMTVFPGTANQNFMVTDQTGSRRWLVMGVHSIDRERVKEIVAGEGMRQLYAQAWQAVMVEGQPWWLNAEEDRIRERLNEEHRAVPEGEAVVDTYMQSITDAHEKQWLSATQVAEVLRVRYHGHSWGTVREALDKWGVDYRVKVRTGNRVLQKVYGFPVLPEVYRNLKAGIRLF